MGNKAGIRIGFSYTSSGGLVLNACKTYAIVASMECKQHT